MFFSFFRKQLLISICLVSALSAVIFLVSSNDAVKVSEEKDYIKWMDFNASYSAMSDALDADIKSCGKYSWIDLLAYLAASNGNNFSSYKKSRLDALISKLEEGAEFSELTKDMNYFKYYQETMSAVLSEYVGEYALQVQNPLDEDEPLWETRYGLKVFSPIASGYGFSDYDDFANARSYGYARRHTGHDLFGSIGTPVVAIESGIAECVGWNQYGGWRIGIRSFDKKRYYYYAHLRKDHPYTPIVKEGARITAGDIIGYIGMTGYSRKENTNNINVPHLHLGIQIIFDESQKDGRKEIWIDAYELTKLLQKNKSQAVKKENNYVRKYNLYER